MAERSGEPEVLHTIIDPVEEEFVRDLEGVETIAQRAEEQGADRMILEVNW